MVAIETYWIGPSAHRGPRVVAQRMDWTASARRRVISDPDDTKCHEDAHLPAVKKLCALYGWHGKMTVGGSNRGYVWVWVPNDTPLPGPADGRWPTYEV